MKAHEKGTNAAGRLPFIDALRGFALFGVFGANLMIFSGFTFMTDEQKASIMSTVFDQIANGLYLFFVETKFIGLFSFLFGISFWLFLDRALARGASATPLFYRRIGWLFVFGAVHGWLFWFMDILRFYALWAIFLPLFFRTPLRRLFAIALSFAVLLPAILAGIVAMLAQESDGPAHDALALAAFSTGAYSEVLAANWKYDWYFSLTISPWGYQLAVFGRLLLGLCAARAVNLANLESHRGALKRLLLGGAIVGLIGNSVFAGHFLAEAEGFFLPFLRRLIVESGYLGLTLAYASGLSLLFMKMRWRRFIQWLAPVGRMALTWYLLQTVFGIWFFYGFVPAGPKAMGKIGPAWLVVIWVVGFSIQVALAHAWMRRFRLGPAEWLWRTATYWRVQPLRAGARAAG